MSTPESEVSHQLVEQEQVVNSPATQSQPLAPMQINGISPLVAMLASGQLKKENVQDAMLLQQGHEDYEAKKAYNVAMAKARTLMGSAAKSKGNTFTGSSYADLSDLIRAAGPALSSNGFNWSWKFDHSEKGFLNCDCHVTHELGHTETYPCRMPDSIAVTSKQGKAVNNPAQAAGSARTYAKRYSFSDAVGLATEDDDGHAAGGYVQSEPAPIEIINDKQASEIEDLLIKLEDNESGFRGRWVGHYKSVWGEIDLPPGLAIPVKEHTGALAELKKKLSKHESAAQVVE